MLYTVNERRETLRADLSAALERIADASGLRDIIFSHGVLAGRLQELEHLGVLQAGERHAWLLQAGQVCNGRLAAFNVGQFAPVSI